MGISTVAGWETAYATPTSMIPFTTETISQTFDRLESQSLTGSAARQPSLQGPEAVKGDTNHELDTNNYGDLIKSVFGAEAGGVYTITDDQVPEYRWIEFEKDVERWRYGASKTNKIVISGSAGNLVMISFGHIVRTRARTGTAFAAISPATQNRIRFQDAQFRLADQGDAIGAGDILGISSFEFTFDRAHKDDDRDSVSKQYIIEPIPNDFLMTSLKIGFPRYNDSNKHVIDWREQNTPLMADLILSDGGEFQNRASQSPGG